jgi:hypothetical protein
VDGVGGVDGRVYEDLSTEHAVSYLFSYHLREPNLHQVTHSCIERRLGAIPALACLAFFDRPEKPAPNPALTYFTVRLSVVVCDNEPDMAVTVSV